MASRSFESVAARARELGLLLLTDKSLPSVAGLVAGAPVRGSWWSHPKGHEIWSVVEQLSDHPDFVVTKLVSGKVTFVHRKLWPALLAVATAREPWQVRALSPAARRLLRRVEGEESVRVSGRPASELETRLLVHAEQVHTSSGRHEKLLESWEHWAKRLKFKGRTLTPAEAKRQLEAASGGAKLPWM